MSQRKKDWLMTAIGFLAGAIVYGVGLAYATGVSPVALISKTLPFIRP